MSEQFGPTEIAYGNLLCRHLQAAQDCDKELQRRIFDAIEVFEELWPAETKRWNEMFSGAVGQAAPK